VRAWWGFVYLIGHELLPSLVAVEHSTRLKPFGTRFCTIHTPSTFVVYLVKHDI
jgi:hypothetical protein